ncbi:MAG TPA: SDR family NAD(P)-dependent oxidoreductase [Ktedonobacterales bacterium]|jgi:NAD(P)-dependent dehydrogenase (short-subunit alcohol dehydrogenase family)|nr:SDR family NAD(P)-dependent oxidoreductase [Ktedonobacterales bacterium]
MKLTPGTVAVVTGAGSGIGRALALHLAARGCDLALADVNREGISETVEQIVAAGKARIRVTTHVVDVADWGAIQRFAGEVEQRHSSAQLLINNAGVALGGTFEQVSLEDFAWVMGINFWGVVHGCKAFLPILRRQPAAHIVNLSSVFGLVAPPGQAAYSSSKFAVRGFSQALAGELRDTPIRVSVVHPGGVRTNIARNARVGAVDPELARAGAEYFERALRMPPEQAAAIIVRGVERDQPRILVGNDARMLDAMARALPGRVGKIVADQTPERDR